MNATRLSLIMQHLHLSATELARAIHVHPSLVSRWKNGDRALSNNSEHLNKIVDYIIERDTLTEYKNIDVFLKQYRDLNITSRKDAQEYLKEYLATAEQYVYHNQGGNLVIPKTGEVNIYQGGREKKQAFLSFLEHCLTFEPGETIYIMIGEDMNKFLDMNPYYAKWSALLHKTIEHGHNIHFIYSYTYQSIITNVKNFYWLASHENWFPYSTGDASIASNSGNLVILKDSLALCDFYTEPQDNKTPLFSFSDDIIVKQLQKLMISVLNQSHLLKVNEQFQKLKNTYSFIRKRIGADEPIYVYDESLFIFPISLDLMRQILKDNNLTDDEIMEYLERYNSIFYKPFVSKKSTFFKRFIINVDRLHETLSGDKYMLPPDLIGEKGIIIDRKYYKKYIEEILIYLNRPPEKKDIEFAFVDNSEALESMEMMTMVKKNLFALVWPALITDTLSKPILFSYNPIVTDAWDVYDNLWNNIENEYKNDYTTKALLSDMLDNL